MYQSENQKLAKVCPVLATVLVCSTILVQHSFVTLNHLLVYRIILTIMHVHFLCHYQAYGFLCFSQFIPVFGSGEVAPLLLFFSSLWFFSFLRETALFVFLPFALLSGGIIFIGCFIFIINYCIAGFLRRVLIFAFFARQNNLVKINSHWTNMHVCTEE